MSWPLLDHLRQTGTGEAKLEEVAKLLKQKLSDTGLVEAAAKVVPEGTLEKIKEFVKAGKPEAGKPEGKK